MFEEYYETCPKRSVKSRVHKECGKKAVRVPSTFQPRFAVGDMDFHTNKGMGAKLMKDETVAKEYLALQAKKSQERQNEMGQHRYSSYNFKPKDYVDAGKARRLTKDEFNARNKVRKQQTADAHKRINQDPAKKIHRQ